MRTFSIYDNVSVSPCVVLEKGALATGIYTSGGELLPDTQFTRSARDISVDLGVYTEPSDELAEAIYAGPLLNHYGHFMLEAIARLWYAKDKPELPIIWSCRVLPGLNDAQLDKRKRQFSFQKDILEYLGIRNPQVLIVKPTRVGKLHVPQVGYRISDTFTELHDDFLSCCDYNPQDDCKLWLSRSALKDIYDAGELNAGILEKRLKDDGWEIFHPQEHSFKDQIAKLARAKRIAGFEGSALHNIIFLSNCSDLQVDIVLRRKSVNPNYVNIAKRKGFTQRLVLTDDRKIIVGKGAHVLAVSPRPANLVSDLKLPPDNSSSIAPSVSTKIVSEPCLENAADNEQAAFRHGADEIEKELKALDRFSEQSGCNQILMFDDSASGISASLFKPGNLKAKYSVVSSQFYFDYSKYAAGSHRFFEIEQKLFFDHFCDSLDPWDLCLIVTNGDLYRLSQCICKLVVQAKRQLTNYLIVSDGPHLQEVYRVLDELVVPGLAVESDTYRNEKAGINLTRVTANYQRQSAVDDQFEHPSDIVLRQYQARKIEDITLSSKLEIDQWLRKTLGDMAYDQTAAKFESAEAV